MSIMTNSELLNLIALELKALRLATVWASRQNQDGLDWDSLEAAVVEAEAART